MTTQTFKQLLVWQKSHAFVLAVYKYTNVIADVYKKPGKAGKTRLPNIYTNSQEGEKTLSNDMQWHLSFRLTVFPANLTFARASSKMLQSYVSKFYLPTPNFYILCST